MTKKKIITLITTTIFTVGLAFGGLSSVKAFANTDNATGTSTVGTSTPENGDNSEEEKPGTSTPGNGNDSETEEKPGTSTPGNGDNSGSVEKPEANKPGSGTTTEPVKQEKPVDISGITSGNQEITFDNVNGTVKLPAGFLSGTELKDVTNLILEVETSKISTTSQEAVKIASNGYKVVGNTISLDLSGMKNGVKTEFHEFDKAVSFTLNFTNEELKGLDTSKLVIVYLNDDGTIEVMPTKWEGNSVTFSTMHFSTFYLAEKAEDKVVDTDKDNNTTKPNTNNGVTTTDKATGTVNKVTNTKTGDSNSAKTLAVLAISSLALVTICAGLSLKKKEYN